MSQDTDHRITWKAVARQVLVSVAVVSLVTAFFTAARLAGNQETLHSVDPLNQNALRHLKEAAGRHPRDQALKDAFREVDTEARRRFYRAKIFGRRGAFILAGACLVFVVSLHLLVLLSKGPPRPGSASSETDPTNVLLRTGLVAGGITALVFALLLGRADRGSEADAVQAAEALPPDVVTASLPKPIPFDADKTQWTGFRGVGGLAVTEDTEAPTAWDGASGKGILWKVVPPKPGFSSPILYNGKLFITGADKQAREIYCYDATNGKLLWTATADDIVGSPAKLPEVSEDTGYAAPTAVTDGTLVYAIFATGDILAVDFEGKRLWGRNLGVPDNPYGHASSLLVHQGNVLVQYDHFGEARFLALDTHTGTTRWEQKRDVGASWASPILVRTRDRVIAVLNAEPLVQAFDAESGERLWSCECMGGEVGPSPAYDAGLAFVTTDYATLAAITLTGEKAGTIVWQTDEELPDVASPVAHAGLLFTVTSVGVISCYDARDGKLQWREEAPEGYYSSPVIAGQRLYLTDRNGKTRVYKVARKPALVATNSLGEPMVSTLAFWRGKLYMRGVKHLFCIGKP